MASTQSLLSFPDDTPALRRSSRGTDEEGDVKEVLRLPKRQRGDGGRAQKCCPPHGPVFHNARCLQCNREVPDLDRRMLVRLDFVLKGLAIESHFLDGWRTRDLSAVQRGGKLLLVLDLDETLLHSRALKDLCPTPVHDPGREFHVVRSVQMATKLRPFAREFLSEASAMYEMHIYTMGPRMYADAMAELLDPEGEYFHGSNRVLCCDDCTVKRTKGLDVVLGHPSAIVVLDNKPGVWAKGDRGNVVHVDKFLWDPHGYNGGDSILRKMLDLLGRIHADYFRQGPGRDVREIMRSARRETLRGCRLLFADKTTTSLVLPIGRGRTRKWKKIAEEMGATATAASGMPEATHLVCRKGDAAKWAKKNTGAAVVDVEWLKKAYFTWKRPREEPTIN